MKKLRNFFNELISRFRSEKIYEVRLWGLNDESFNKDEDLAWQVMIEIYEDVLKDDKNWHFFYENWYNIIRCSASFYPELIKKLDELNVYYVEHGEWVDEQPTTRKHQDIYQGLFHYFTLMSFTGYETDDIKLIYDRVSHCFLNHQFYKLKNYREKRGRHWESDIMYDVMRGRTDYSAYCFYKGINPCRSNHMDTSEKSIKEQVEEHYINKDQRTSRRALYK
jgi:hypothetical protein